VRVPLYLCGEGGVDTILKGRARILQPRPTYRHEHIERESQERTADQQQPHCRIVVESNASRVGSARDSEMEGYMDG
jgi:hypothetical protein